MTDEQRVPARLGERILGAPRRHGTRTWALGGTALVAGGVAVGLVLATGGHQASVAGYSPVPPSAQSDPGAAQGDQLGPAE